MRQGTPAAAFLEEVKHGIEDLMEIDLEGFGFRAGRFEQGTDAFELPRAEIAGI